MQYPKGGTSSFLFMSVKPPDYNVIFPAGTLLEGPDLPDPEPAAPKPPRDDTHRLIRNKNGKGSAGGCYAHNPTCLCNPCKARRREAEALAIPAGVGGMRLATDSDPIRTLTTKNGHKAAAPRSLRSRVAQYIHFSVLNPNATLKDLAGMMGIAPGTLYKVIKEGQETGILTFDDPLARIEHEIIPKVVDNLTYFLDKKDKTVTIEAAKGTIFRQFQDSKGISDGNQTVLALKIEQADGTDIKVMTGHIVGSPKGLPTIHEN